MRNAAALLEFGDTFGLRSLRAAALNLALRDFGAFVASDGFAGLPPPLAAQLERVRRRARHVHMLEHADHVLAPSMRPGGGAAAAGAAGAAGGADATRGAGSFDAGLLRWVQERLTAAAAADAPAPSDAARAPDATVWSEAKSEAPAPAPAERGAHEADGAAESKFSEA